MRLNSRVAALERRRQEQAGGCCTCTDTWNVINLAGGEPVPAVTACPACGRTQRRIVVVEDGWVPASPVSSPPVTPRGC